MTRTMKLLVAILLFAATQLAAMAAAVTPPAYGCRRVTATSLNVRASPCATAGKLTSALPSGTYFHYTGTASASKCGDSNRWIKIIWNNKAGWVSSGVPSSSKSYVSYCPTFTSSTITPFPTSSHKFINQVAPGAVKSMYITNVPASVSIAQAILESGWGKSRLAVQGNNLFGIKGSGNCGSIKMPTKEYINGKYVTVQAAFRKYCSFADSVIDHGYFFLDNSRYQSAMKSSGSSSKFARQIQSAGYATDPRYASKLNSLIADYRLTRFDLVRSK